jgi:F-type H+-transporting ATPase subunit gamma
MAQQLRTLKRRIDSVKSTQKVTRAMELIASSRIVRAQQRVEAARPYGDAVRRLVASVATSATNVEHPLVTGRERVGSTGTLVMTSDRGLAGAYNSNVIRAAERDMRERDQEDNLYVVGRKGVSYFRFRGHELRDSWTGFSEQPKIENARAVAERVAGEFVDGHVDRVRVAHTKFESALTQRPAVLQLLPVPVDELVEGDEVGGSQATYQFEPSPEEIMDYLLPRYVESIIYQALLESAASELAARRRAMKAATDNADELIEDLTRVFNQARQAEITTEIMEVVGGAEALTAASQPDQR